MQAFAWQPVAHPAEVEYHEHGGLMGFDPHFVNFGASPETELYYDLNNTYDATKHDYLPNYSGSGQSNSIFKVEQHESPSSGSGSGSVDATGSVPDWTRTASASPQSQPKATPIDHRDFVPVQQPKSLQESSTHNTGEQKRPRRSYRPRKAPVRRDKLNDEDDVRDMSNEMPQASQNLNLQERNRLAASKCRRNKRRWEHDLEEGKERLETENAKLQQSHRELTEEVMKLKSLLMGHASCSDKTIDLWIRNEAQKFVAADNSTTRTAKEKRS